MPPEAPLGLDNCDREPIHIPGRVQSHGVLVVFGQDGRVTHRSANAASVLGALAPSLGQALADTCLAADADMLELVEECFRSDGVDVQPVALEVAIGDSRFEIIGHRLGERVLVELELLQHAMPATADDAFKGHRALSRLKRQRTVDDLMAVAVEEVRALTGFDRVMAYRFRHDDSGDVVAEARAPALEPLVGRRYPAGDIPAQARRLYTINTLRIIVDVASATVPIEAMAGDDAPLDMSHSVLRSVSPVHIEYLGNMGVGASMSISVVLSGRLWGMLACHHMGPRHVPYRVRSACDVLAHVLAANVQSLTARAHAQRLEAAASVRARAIEGVLHADEGVFALLPQAQALCETFEAHGMVLTDHGRLATWGGVPAEAARRLLAWLDASQRGTGLAPLVARHSLADLPAELRADLGIWCGFVALKFGQATPGWLVLLRKEQIETIAWGGKPDKEYAHGPLGPRLTPRGSFDVWKETVHGCAVPWDGTDIDIAQAMLSELVRATSARAAELDRARSHLLRLLSDGMASPHGPDGAALQDASDAVGATAGSRMQRFVSQVLDAARLQTDNGLPLRQEALDLARTVDQLIDDESAVDRSVRFIREIPKTLVVEVDAARLRQLIAGLLANARVHGDPEEPIVVQLTRQGDRAVLEVSNVGAEIAPDVARTIFEPFRAPPGTVRANRDSLGLGLYIARRIARAHGGDLVYAYAEPYVVFSLSLPVPSA